MLPLPDATTVLASATPVSNAVFGAFQPYMFMEIGIVLAVLAVLFIIGIFSGLFSKILGHHSNKFDNK